MTCKSKIEWTESTWNPITGCSKISEGCRNCYAERMAHRLRAMGQPRYMNGFNLTIHEDALESPLYWSHPRVIFVNSMSDLFHEDVPFHFIRSVFDVMQRSRQHIFQVLTKRSERLLDLAPLLPWPENVWMGVTVEHHNYGFRAEHLRQTEAKIKFLSIEPMLGPLTDLDLSGIDWVIVGGESGPKARPMNPDWVRAVRDQCDKANVLFFFKQWGGTNKKKAGRKLDGRTWDDMPPTPSHYKTSYSACPA